jgi:acetyl-CoA synthetase
MTALSAAGRQLRASSRSRFRWAIPARCNIAEEACDRWADGSGRTAMIHLAEDGTAERISFDELHRRACRLANCCWRAGRARAATASACCCRNARKPPSRILPPTASGAVAVPLFLLFGEDALEYRLADCARAALVTDAAGLAKLAAIRDRLPGAARPCSPSAAAPARSTSPRRWPARGTATPASPPAPTIRR